MLMEKHDSIRRNRSLASVFFAAGYVENWGQGIGKVIDLCRANGNPDPVFSERCGGLSVEIGINPATVIVDVPSKLDLLDAKDIALINCIKQNASVTMPEMSVITGISARTVERCLKLMMESNIITREGSRKTGKWIIVKN